jgi:hypothetical protein
MTEQQSAYAPPKRKYLGLWFAGAVVVLAVVVGIVFRVTPEAPPVADSSLEPGLLVAADFPPEFFVSTMTQAELDRLPTALGQPDTVNPTECSELIRAADRSPGGQSIAIVQASDSTNGVVYAQEIVRADEVPGWDPRQGETRLAACGEMTIAYKGRTTRLYSSRVEGIAGDGYATSATTGESYGIGGVTVAVAMTRVGDYIVMFTGASAVLSMGSVFDEDEFVRLANVANERVRARL